MTSTVVAPGHRAIPPSAASRIRSKFSPVFFEGVTTGTSIGLLIENTDQRSQDYSAIKDVFRPVPCRLHLRTKNTVCAIIAAVDVLPPAKPPCAWRQELLPKKYLAEKFGIEIRGCLTQMGDIPLDIKDWSQVEQKSVFLPGPPTKSTR